MRRELTMKRFRGEMRASDERRGVLGLSGELSTRVDLGGKWQIEAKMGA